MLRKLLTRAARAFRRSEQPEQARREVEDPAVEPREDRHDEHEPEPATQAGREPSERLPVDSATPPPD